MRKIFLILMRHFILFLSCLLAPLPAVAAGFDCAKAGTPVEKMICADTALSLLDQRLAGAYRQALSIGKDRAALKKTQLVWLKSIRNRCPDAACLQDAYNARLAELASKTGAVLPGISGEYQRYDGGRPDANSATITLRTRDDGQVDVSGEATWIGDPGVGNVHEGGLNGTFFPENGKIHYRDGDECRLTISMTAGALTVTDDNALCGGANVSFDGRYRKVKAAR